MRARRYCVGFEVVSLVVFCLVGDQVVEGFLTRTLRAATMVRGSGDIVVDMVACWSWVANVYSVASFGVVAVGSCRAWCFFRPLTLVLAFRADELSWVCFNSDMILFCV